MKPSPGSPGSPGYSDVVRRCYAIAAIATVSAIVLFVSITLHFRNEVRMHGDMHFHVRGVMLMHEIEYQTSRIKAVLDANASGEPGSQMDMNPSTGTGTGTGVAVGAGPDRSRDHRAAVAMASISQALDQIDRNQAAHRDPYLDGTIARTRDRFTRLKVAIDRSEPMESVLVNLESFSISTRQLHQLYTRTLEDAFDEIAADAERGVWRFAGIVAAILIATVAVVVQLLGRIRSSLRRHQETERELLERERQLQHAQKIQALGTLVGGVAHDFNNLLTAILGNAQILRAELPPGNPAAESAEEIQSAGERAASLTRQLLAFSRYELVERGVVALNAGLRDMQPLLRRLIREDIVVNLNLDDRVRAARLDSVQLEQVVLNLATNASDSMPGGGSITIETTPVDLDSEGASRRNLKAGRYSRIRVVDEGSGIPPDVQSRIFEPFFTTKERGEGSGLGLSTVQGIVEKIGGQISVDSEVNRGTCFEVYLPEEGFEQADPDVSGPADLPGELDGTETILLVEDNDHVRTLAARGLRECGYSVLVASDGHEALSVCRNHPDPIQVILTDVILPGLSGPDIVERVRRLRPDIVAVFMTGYSDDVMLEKVRVTRDPIVPKPFKLHDLLRAVRRQADRGTGRRAMNHTGATALNSRDRNSGSGTMTR